MEQIFPGVWKIRLGQPEAQTPVSFRHIAPAVSTLKTLAAPETPPFDRSTISYTVSERGVTVRLPLAADEQLYGFGLQMHSFNQRWKKKTIRVNSDPVADLGDSHAPAPFYVTTHGYGILVDTARYAAFYCGTAKTKADLLSAAGNVANEQSTVTSGLFPGALFTPNDQGQAAHMFIEIPLAEGVDIYLFAGPEIKQAVQRYNLFSGGGCLPPRWGLGVWYRVRADFAQREVLNMAEEFRAERMPCDVLGIEPGWQTYTYPATFVWSDKFPNPGMMIAELQNNGFRTNLWTHAFVHPFSPIFQDIAPYSGNFLSMGGLVPDLTIPAARSIMAHFHEQHHVNLGVSGYKLDECDNSDFIAAPWSFPEMSRFPSGIDGEQFHSFFGIHYQEMILGIYRQQNKRTFGQVRSSHALAAPYPFVLYSDLYSHKDFIRALVNAGFSGMLWSPEVRHAVSAEDLIRRLQTVVCSPQALLNAWYIKHAPWKQWDTRKNNADQLLGDKQELADICRDILNLRMQLLPYLYTAFSQYALLGIPPFRALVMDYPHDAEVFALDDQYMMGDSLLVAPVVAGCQERRIYLPQGSWYDFWTGDIFEGSQWIIYQVPLHIIPIFVKAGTLLPLASVAQHADDPNSWQLHIRVYGKGNLSTSLFEDDDATNDYQHGSYNIVTISWDATTQNGTIQREGSMVGPQYQVKEYQVMGKE